MDVLLSTSEAIFGSPPRYFNVIAGDLAVADVERLEIGEMTQLGEQLVVQRLSAEDAGAAKIDARHPLVRGDHRIAPRRGHRWLGLLDGRHAAVCS